MKLNDRGKVGIGAIILGVGMIFSDDARMLAPFLIGAGFGLLSNGFNKEEKN